MQKITPFVWFNGNAEEAMNFYLSIFSNAKLVRMARNPPGAPAPEGDFLVATIELDGQQLSLMDGGPGHPLTDAVSLMVNCQSQEEVDHYWNKLLEGGGKEIACGWLKDRFGLHWQVTPVMLMQLMADEDRAKAGRVMQAMMKMIKLDIAALQAAADNR